MGVLAVEPMLMSDRSADMVSETMTAGNGMFQVGETCDSHRWPGTPASRAKAIDVSLENMYRLDLT